MFGNRRSHHHRSDFFLGNMEEAWQEQKKRSSAPKAESREEKRERESGLLPVWQKPVSKKTKTAKSPAEKTEKKIREKKVPALAKEEKAGKEKTPKAKEIKEVKTKEVKAKEVKETKTKEVKAKEKKSTLLKEKAEKIKAPKAKEEKVKEPKAKKNVFKEKKIWEKAKYAQSDDEVEFISTEDVEISPSAPFIMPDNPDVIPNIVPEISLENNPEVLPSKKQKEKKKEVVPVLKGMQNPEAMPGYKPEAIPDYKKEEKPSEKKEEVKEEKKLTPFSPKELEEIFQKSEEEEKDLAQQSEEMLLKAVEKSRQWIKKQTKDSEKSVAGLKKAVAQKITDKTEKTLFALKEKRVRKKREKLSSTTKKVEAKADPFLSSPEHRKMQEKVKDSLDGMYDVFQNKNEQKKAKLKASDIVRYAVLFLCIFGFVGAGAFVFTKLYDYYRSYVVYSGLQELVAAEDYLQGEYLKKTASSLVTLTPQSILNGEEHPQNSPDDTFTSDQQNLVNKIAQLKKINEDTVGWIKIPGTVVNYPVVWSELKNYYLHRDFYGKTLSGGTIYVDERNTADITENRNTVIYGHNMTDGSMFASIHDFANATTFYNATIEITTEEGVFIYTPFSVHESDAYDNYFETDFVSDEDFIAFCEQMKFISIYETDFEFDKDSRIITLSTCGDDQRDKNERFAVHAILTKVIR